MNKGSDVLQTSEMDLVHNNNAMLVTQRATTHIIVPFLLYVNLSLLACTEWAPPHKSTGRM